MSARCWPIGARTSFASRGSGASGTFARSASDLDLLVSMEPGRSLLDLVGLELDLESELGVEVDVLTERSLHDLIRDDVLAEAVAA